MIWKRTRFFAPNEILVDATYCWIAQRSWSYPFLFQPLDVVCSVALPHTLPKSQCKQWRIGDRPQAKTTTTGGLLLHLAHQHKHPQFHECLHLVPTKPIACCLYDPQTTIIHHTELLVSPFFGCDLHLARHLCIFIIDIGLQPLFRHSGGTSDASKRNPF